MSEENETEALTHGALIDALRNTETAAAVGAELATELGKVEVLHVGEETGKNPSVLSVPAGRRIVSVKRYLDQYRTQPERRSGVARFTDLASFVAHAERFKDADSALFAQSDPKAPKITSVINYHRAGPEVSASPRFGDHRGVWDSQLSDEWKAWTEKNGKAMVQADFAAFIEDRLLDVVDPAGVGGSARDFAETLGITFATPSKLLEVSRGLSLRLNARMQNAVNLTTGEAAISYVTEHESKDGQPITVPAAFVIAVPVFVAGDPYAMPVRLRYRHRDGSIAWFYELARSQAVFDHAFTEACDHARDALALPLFYGSPEP